MKRNGRFLAIAMCALFLMAMMSAAVLFAAEVTITGKISEQGIVADDGQVYAVAENEKGKEIMEHVDKTVKATGTVEEREGKKVITVTNYEVTE
jgi:outer membrane usher protein FimD/PapC